jgi:hypothetical protein
MIAAHRKHLRLKHNVEIRCRGLAGKVLPVKTELKLHNLSWSDLYRLSVDV